MKKLFFTICLSFILLSCNEDDSFPDWDKINVLNTNGRVIKAKGNTLTYKFTAIPSFGFEFDGWYNKKGNILSKDSEFEFDSETYLDARFIISQNLEFPLYFLDYEVNHDYSSVISSHHGIYTAKAHYFELDYVIKILNPDGKLEYAPTDVTENIEIFLNLNKVIIEDRQTPLCVIDGIKTYKHETYTLKPKAAYTNNEDGTRTKSFYHKLTSSTSNQIGFDVIDIKVVSKHPNLIIHLAPTLYYNFNVGDYSKPTFL